MAATEARAPAALDVFGAALDGATLVEASAGTGKTWAICGLVLRLLLERGLGIQQILVVTFTNAATAELRERIRERLRQTLDRLRDKPCQDAPATPDADPFVDRLLQHLQAAGLPDATLQSRLDLALQQFDEAAIHTIHGFCQRALGDAPLSAGLPLQQDTQADDGPLRLQVAHDFWRQHIAAGGLPAALLAHMAARGDSPEAWAAQLKRRRAKPLARLLWPADIDTAPALDAAALQQAVAAAQAAWQSGRDSFLAKLDAARPSLNGNYFRGAAIAHATAQWDLLLAVAGSGALADIGVKPADSKLHLFTPARLSATKTSAKKALPMAADPFPALAEALLARREAAQASLDLARLQWLRRWLEAGPAALQAAQRQQRVQSYDDLLFNLYQRLHAPAGTGAAGGAGDALAETLRSRYPAALIDEFQDTDPLQYAIFRRIYLAGGTAMPVFFVGDPKQAIYSFRHADLRTYLQARAEATREATLGDNQRSVPALVQACNALFSQHGLPFRDPGLPFRPVGVGDKQRAVLAEGGPAAAALQLWALPGADGAAVLAKPAAQELAAAATASEIVRLLQAAAAGTLRLGERAVRARDIAVLVRSHRQGAMVRQALQDRGVGSVEMSQASLFDSPDAEELATVLAAVLQPGRSGLVRAALATDLLGLDAQALAALRETAAGEAGFARHVQAFSNLRSLWAERGIGVMLRRLQADTDVPARLLARPDGERRLTNLLHLAESLQQAALDQPAPEALLRWLQRQRSDPQARDQEAAQLRLASDRHLVQIVTIHRSKGLEYPFVFCPFLWDGAPGGSGQRLEGREGHDRATGEAVIDFRRPGDAGAEDADGAGNPDVVDASSDQAAENLRLVYVALTRAVQRCWLVVGPYRGRGRGQNVREAAASPLHWLLAGQAAPAMDAPALLAAWHAFAAQLAASHPGAVQLLPLPAPSPARWAAPPADAASLQALAGPLRLPAPWRMGSYSSLMQGARHETAAVDHDRRLLPTALPDTNAAAALPPDDILRFPRGAAAGECLHAVFEHSDFCDSSSWAGAVDAALAAHAQALPGARREPVLAMLADLLHTPLLPASSPGLCLAGVPLQRRLNELEFTLPAPGLQAQALQALLRDAGLGGPPLAFGALQGHLRGYIDLVFEHAGRFHVLDWKSNHLGDSAAHYEPAALATAMAAQGYHLQLLLYTVALHRWLQARLAGYRYEQHVGAGLYLFVRGVRPHWQAPDGRPCGVHAWRPSLALVEAASALLGSAGQGPGLAMLDESLDAQP